MFNTRVVQNCKKFKYICDLCCVFKPPPICQRSCWSNGRRAPAAVTAATLPWNSRWLCTGHNIVNALQARPAAFSIIRALKVPWLSHWSLWPQADTDWYRPWHCPSYRSQSLIVARQRLSLAHCSRIWHHCLSSPNLEFPPLIRHPSSVPQSDQFPSLPLAVRFSLTSTPCFRFVAFSTLQAACWDFVSWSCHCEFRRPRHLAVAIWQDNCPERVRGSSCICRCTSPIWKGWRTTESPVAPPEPLHPICPHVTMWCEWMKIPVSVF